MTQRHYPRMQPMILISTNFLSNFFMIGISFASRICESVNKIDSVDSALPKHNNDFSSFSIWPRGI